MARFRKTTGYETAAAITGAAAGMAGVVAYEKGSLNASNDAIGKMTDLTGQISGIEAQRTDLGHLHGQAKVIVGRFLNNEIHSRQTEIQALTPQSHEGPSTLGLAGELAGFGALAAFTLAALSRGVRYSLYRRRQSAHGSKLGSA